MIRRLATCFAAIAAAMLMVFALSACGAKEINVSVVDGDDVYEVTTQPGQTVEQILAASQITLNEGDEVDPALDTKIEESGATITIERMVNVVVAVDGNNVDVAILGGGTVQDALDQAQVTLADGDTVDIDVATPLENEMLITVTRAPKPEPKAENSGNSGNSGQSSGRSVVSKTKVPDCGDPNHGYYEIVYSDGTTDYQEY